MWCGWHFIFHTTDGPGWIRSNTKTGPVLDVKIYPHEKRYCMDIMIESLFKDQAVSWVRIVNHRNVRRNCPLKVFNLTCTGRLVAKAKPRPNHVVNVSSNYVLINERIWIDVNPTNLIKDWISTLARGEGPKKRFQNCLNPNSSKHFLYFRAIQEHSGGYFVDTLLQDNVLLPDDFTGHIYHIGNAFEQKGQAVRVFHSSEPDGCSTRSERS